MSTRTQGVGRSHIPMLQNRASHVLNIRMRILGLRLRLGRIQPRAVLVCTTL